MDEPSLRGKLSSLERHILQTILFNSDDDGNCLVQQKDLIAMSDVEQHLFYRKAKELVEKGFITKEGRSVSVSKATIAVLKSVSRECIQQIQNVYPRDTQYGFGMYPRDTQNVSQRYTECIPEIQNPPYIDKDKYIPPLYPPTGGEHGMERVSSETPADEQPSPEPMGDRQSQRVILPPLTGEPHVSASDRFLAYRMGHKSFEERLEEDRKRFLADNPNPKDLEKRGLLKDAKHFAAFVDAYPKKTTSNAVLVNAWNRAYEEVADGEVLVEATRIAARSKSFDGDNIQYIKKPENWLASGGYKPFLPEAKDAVNSRHPNRHEELMHRIAMECMEMPDF